MHDELRARLIAAFRWADPGAETPHLVSDASGWWRDPDLLARMGPALAAPFTAPFATPLTAAAPTVVVAPEVGGFLIGPLVARELGAGFVEAYKDGGRKIAGRTLARVAPTDHRGRTVTLRLRARHLSAADRVLVVDDWADTGGQLAALRDLVRDTGATYLGASVIVDGTDSRTRAELSLHGLLGRADLDQRAWAGPDLDQRGPGPERA